MKKIIINTFLIVTALFFYGCPNDDGPFEMYTKIKKDGSCYREFIRSTDSAFVAGDTSRNPFPMKLDSTWKVTFYTRMADDTSRYKNLPASTKYKQNGLEYSIFAIAQKEYASVESLAKSFRFNDSDWDSIVPDIEFKKNFRWFYTYYEFTETYAETNPFKIVPISNYLSKEEIAALYGEDLNLYKGKNGFEIMNLLKDLEGKSEAWLSKSLFEETYRIYLNQFRQFKNMPIDSATLAMAKDSIFKYYGNNDTLEFSLFDGDLDKALDHYFHTNAFSANVTDETNKLIEKDLLGFIELSGMELNYKISLPGKIIETNAPFLKGDTLTWRVEDDRFFFTNYSLIAKSRSANYWAFGLTAIIVILSILGFRVKRKQ